MWLCFFAFWMLNSHQSSLILAISAPIFYAVFNVHLLNYHTMVFYDDPFCFCNYWRMLVKDVAESYISKNLLMLSQSSFLLIAEFWISILNLSISMLCKFLYDICVLPISSCWHGKWHIILAWSDMNWEGYTCISPKSPTLTITASKVWPDVCVGNDTYCFKPNVSSIFWKFYCISFRLLYFIVLVSACCSRWMLKSPNITIQYSNISCAFFSLHNYIQVDSCRIWHPQAINIYLPWLVFCLKFSCYILCICDYFQCSTSGYWVTIV